MYVRTKDLYSLQRAMVSSVKIVRDAERTIFKGIGTEIMVLMLSNWSHTYEVSLNERRYIA